MCVLSMELWTSSITIGCIFVRFGVSAAPQLCGGCRGLFTKPASVDVWAFALRLLLRCQLPVGSLTFLRHNRSKKCLFRSQAGASPLRSFILLRHRKWHGSASMRLMLALETGVSCMALARQSSVHSYGKPVKCSKHIVNTSTSKPERRNWDQRARRWQGFVAVYSFCARRGDSQGKRAERERNLCVTTLLLPVSENMSNVK